MVKFTRRDMRNSFYMNWRNLIDKKAIDLPDLGITAESKVYLSESLTRYKKELFGEVTKLKKVKKSDKIFDDACKQKGFSIFHCNIRSLEKNKSLLHDILSTVKTTPDIIAISESKINDNTSANLNIPGYAFVNTNSKTQAGGVGLYLSNDLKFSRSDLDISDFGIESCMYCTKKYCNRLSIDILKVTETYFIVFSNND